MKYKKTIGITGASGALSRALIRRFKNDGYKIIGFSHQKKRKKRKNLDCIDEEPNEWVYWRYGKESLLKRALQTVDILILNHGIYDAEITKQNFQNSIEINSLSKIKIINMFEDIVFAKTNFSSKKEIWVNTSEAEIFPALSPSYEISKSLIGQVISFKKNLLSKREREKLIFRKIILGPFKSDLNPIGIMKPDYVAILICLISRLNISLIVISLNPLTYLLFPLKEFYYFFYSKILRLIK